MNTPIVEPVVDPTSVVVDRLTEALERLINRPRPQDRVDRDEIVKLKVPQYNGIGDIEYFIQQFNRVANTSGWGDNIRFLKLQESLVDKAQDCGRGDDVHTVIANLRSRFGITQREARSKLRSLRREPKTTLQEHATEVERLVNLAHPNLPFQYVKDLVLETFMSSLGYTSLQRHLMAMRIETLEVAIQAGNEFLEISVPAHKSDGIRQVGDGVVEDKPDQKTASVENPTMTLMGGMMSLLNKLIEKVDNMDKKKTMPINKDNANRGPPTCWTCGEVGHVRSKCLQDKPNTSN